MKKEKSKNYAWIVLLVASIAIFSLSYTQYLISPISKDIMAKFSLNNSQFASIFSAPMVPAIFLSLASGVLVDRFGVKIVISVGLIISAVGTVLRMTAGTYGSLFATMAMTGLGAAFLNANGAKIFGEWFPSEKVSRVMGIFLMASTLGMTIGMGTTAMLNSIYYAFLISAIISTIAAIVWIIFMKNPSYTTAEKQRTLPIGKCLKVVVKSLPVWLVGLSLMFVLGTVVTISSFLPAALISKGISAVSSGAYASMVTIGSLIGSILAPALASKLKNTKGLIFSLAMIAAIFTAFSWNLPEGFVLSICLFITGAAAGGLMPILMSIPIRLKEIGSAYAGTAGGFTGTLQLLGAVVIPTYIVVPLAGNNTAMLFILAGICMALVCILSFMFPDLDKH